MDGCSLINVNFTVTPFLRTTAAAAPPLAGQQTHTERRGNLKKIQPLFFPHTPKSHKTHAKLMAISVFPFPESDHRHLLRVHAKR